MMRCAPLAFRIDVLLIAIGLVLIAPPARSAAETHLRPPAEAFAGLPALRSPILSPDGRHLAMLKIVDGDYAPIVIRFEAGQAARTVRIEPASEVKDLLGLAWGGDRHLLISALGSRPSARLPDSRLYIYSLDTGRVEPALETPRPGGHSIRARRASQQRAPSVTLLDPLPHSPGMALISAQRPGDKTVPVLRLDLLTGNHVRILDNSRTLHNILIDPDGRLRLATMNTVSGPQYVQRSDDGQDWQRLDADFDPDRGDALLGFAPDGRGVYVLRPRGRGRQLMRYDLDTDTLREVMPTPRDIDLSAILFDGPPPSGRPIGFRIAGDFERDVYTDPAWRDIQRAIDSRLAGTVNTILSSDRAGRLHVVRAAHAARPDSTYIFASDSRRLTRLGSAHPDLADSTLPAKRLMRYRADDGVDIPAYLTLPLSGGPPWPTVVMPHGGPHSRTYGDFSYWVQFLASRGYAVIEPNFRGSTGYGHDWANAGRGQWGGLMQDDIDAAADWLLAEGIAAPGRICIMGGSFGGYAALMGVARADTPYACAIAVNPATDLERLVNDDLDRLPHAPWTRFVGNGADGEMLLEAVSPVNLAARISIPVLLFHARDDLRLPPVHSRAMASALGKADGSVKYIEADSGGHPLMARKTRLRLLQETAAFLHRHASSPARDSADEGAAP